MRTASLVAAAIVLTAACEGCAAVVLGEYMRASSNKQARERFVADYRSHNLARREAGLDTLDFCAEARRFDRGWADGLAECRPPEKADSAVAGRSWKGP